jgi:hypothetical protein
MYRADGQREFQSPFNTRRGVYAIPYCARPKIRAASAKIPTSIVENYHRIRRS